MIFVNMKSQQEVFVTHMSAVNQSYLPGVLTMSPFGILGATVNNEFGPNWTGE